jgi:hypothetical protein
MLALLAATLALLGWLIWGMATDLSSQPLSYHIQYAQPVNSYLCPGDTLRYEVQVEVSDVPAALTIVESWCEAKLDGVCNQATTREYDLGALRPRQVYALANRIVPDSEFFRVPGRELEFWHTTTTTTNAGVSVTGYVVGPIIIRNNCGDSGEGTGGN